MKHTAILLTIFICLLSLSAPAKENKDLMKANYYYAHFDFHEAIPYFEKVAGQLNDPATFTRLADCYRLTCNLQSAANWYAKAAAMRSCQDLTLLHYAQVLMQLSQYDEAEKWLKKYIKTNRADKRAANLVAGCESAMLNRIQDIPSGTATLLDLNTDGSEFAPTLWKGNLVFTSDTEISTRKKTDNWTGNAYYSMYSVPCDNGRCGTQYNRVAADKEANTKYHDGPCTFSADGRTMYFTRSRSGSSFFSKRSIANKDSVVLLEIMIASGYDSVKKEFRTTMPFQYNSKEYSVAHPTVSPDGNMLIFSSNMPKGRGGSDLYLCLKMKDGAWSAPANLGGAVNTEGEELFPYLADNSTLYFSSDGHEGFGGLDVYKSKWDARTHTFAAPQNIGAPVNSSFDDISLALFADGRSSFFSSNRPAARGGDNIYAYRREQAYLLLKVRDSLTGQPLAGVKVTLDATPNWIITDTITGSNGRAFTQLYPEVGYKLHLSKEGYGSKEIFTSTVNMTDIDTITVDISMYKAPEPVAAPKPVAPVRFTEIVGAPELNKVYEIGQVPFAYNKFSIIPSAKPCLDSLAAFLKKNPTIGIEVRAHTDCRELKPGYNIALSHRRATAVVNYLHDKGIPKDRLTANGLGSSDPRVKCPICEACTEAQHYQNRIMDFKVLKL